MLNVQRIDNCFWRAKIKLKERVDKGNRIIIYVKYILFCNGNFGVL